MSDIRKWIKIMESVPAIFPNQDPKHALIKQDATIMVDPSVGGGTARYMNSTPDGAMVDIKGIAKELSADEFGLPERDYEDGYQKGNDWFHMSVNPDTPGTSNERPEFRSGDMVKIADVYGSVIGPGMGIFIAYSTSGKDAIISFDDKEIVVPVANIAAALEQNSKNNFDEMDNDGNLSPMSFGSSNVKVEEPAMDQRDEFSRWMSAVEEALQTEGVPMQQAMNKPSCECGSWTCPTCFPEMDSEIVAVDDHGQEGTGCPQCSGMGCPACDGSEIGMDVDGLELVDDAYGMEEDDAAVDAFLSKGGQVTKLPYKGGRQEKNQAGRTMASTHIGGLKGNQGDMPGRGRKASDPANPTTKPVVGEEDNHFVEKPKSGKGVKLGDIVHKTEFRKTGGQNSPMTYGEENLGEGFLDLDKVLKAAAALAQAQGKDPDDIWESDWLQDWANSLEQANPSEQELDFIIASGTLPARLANLQFNMGDDFQFGRDLDEELPQGANPADYGKAGRYLQKHFGDGDLDEGNWYEPDHDDVAIDSQFGDEDDMHKQEMADKIENIQNMGFSKDNRRYSRQELMMYSPEEMKACFDRVMGNVTTENYAPGTAPTMPEAAKPTMTKHHLDDIEDILNPRQADLPATVDTDDGEVVGDEQPMHLPAASRADTQRRVGAITPTDTMRDLMNRISPMAGAGEADVIPDTETNAVALRTAADVPAVISNAMQASGMQTPEWHNVNNLPGYSQQNVRGMGRQLFSMFTNTPLEQIQTMANVNGQGPNTDAEMRAVAGWLRDNAQDMGRVDIDHGAAIPGYKPDVKEYSANGVRFHLVRDPLGQYIYAYPESDAKLGSPTQGRAQVAGPRAGMPRLRESTLKPTLLEQMKWDEEIDEAFIEESSLSKLIGKQAGGQKLVQWLHRKHQLSNDANLEPAPFSERMMWKEFKAHPDNFVIVSAENGVAGVKPYKKFIDDRTAEFAKKGKTYNPAGDSTLPYQIIAFTDDGQQIDPALFRQPTEPGEEPEQRYSDPTVMKARMGKHSGKDMQNPNNTFNLLADEIGALRTVYLASGAVERDKISKRADMKKSEKMPSQEAVQKIFTKVRPVLKTLANQAILQINKRAQRYIEGGNFEAAQKVASSGQKLKQLLVTLDTTSPVSINTGYGSKTPELSAAISKAIAQAAGSSVGTERYQDYASEAAAGNVSALRPILDALRDNLVGL